MQYNFHNCNCICDNGGPMWIRCFFMWQKYSLSNLQKCYSSLLKFWSNMSFIEYPNAWNKTICSNSNAGEFRTKWFRDQVNWWIRDQVNSGPSDFRTRGWWFRDIILVISGPIFYSIFFTKISYFDFYFSEILQSVWSVQVWLFV